MADSQDLRKFGIQRYIRAGTLASNLDIKTYDVGTLYIGTTGGPATPIFYGEVWVEYEVELSTPQYDLTSFVTALSAKLVGAGATSLTSYLGTPTITGGLQVTGSGSTLTFNRPGQYLITGSFSGTGLFTTFTVPATGTAIFNQLNGISNAAANLGTTALFNATVNVTDVGQTVAINFTTIATSISFASIRVAPYLTSLT